MIIAFGACEEGSASGRTTAMSDTSRDPGWWLASDGRWYPPETHSDYERAATQTPPGPGWRVAWDGKWYPPDVSRPGAANVTGHERARTDAGRADGAD